MGEVDTVEWPCVLCGPSIQNDWVSRTTNLHKILCLAWPFLCRNYSNDSEGRSYGQLVIRSFITQHIDSCITSHAEFFDETSNHPGDSATLQPRCGTLWLLAFPKTKITFEREEISDHQWYSGKEDRAADGDWENCVRSQSAHFEGDWGVIVLCTLFLVSSRFFNECL